MKKLILLLIAFSVFEIQAQLVINEVNYDIAGQDTSEFIEIKNDSTLTVVLNGHYLLLLSGGGSQPAVYDSIPLPGGAIAAKGYYVICGDTANVKPCHCIASKKTNLIENAGSGTSFPDAIALYDGNGKQLDAISYEGSLTGYVETNGDSIEDDPANDAMGLSRYPDGIDTDNNNRDFSQRCITPGAANTSQSSGCLVVTTNKSTPEDNMVKLYPNPASNTVSIFGLQKVSIKVYDALGNLVHNTRDREMDVSTWSKGLYFVRYRTADIIGTKKLIIE